MVRNRGKRNRNHEGGVVGRITIVSGCVTDRAAETVAGRRGDAARAGFVGGFLLCAGMAIFAGCSHETPGDGSIRPLSYQRTIGEVGLAPGQLAYPRCIDQDGEALWVIDKEARVQRLDPATGACLAIWKMPDSEFGKPTGVTVVADPDRPNHHLMYIADTHYHRIRVYSIAPVDAAAKKRIKEGGFPREQEAQLLMQFGTHGKGPGQFVFPTDVAVLHRADGSIERLYVPEYGGNDRINVFDAEGQFQFAFGEFGSGAQAEPVQFSRPQSVAIDEVRRKLVVTDACNHRLGVFSLDGKLERWISSPDEAGDAPGHFNYPYGLALLKDGSALVTEFGGARMQRIDVNTGAALGIFMGKPDAGAGGKPKGLANPWSCTVLGDSVWVLDTRNNRIAAYPLPEVERSVSQAHPGIGGAAR